MRKLSPLFVTLTLAGCEALEGAAKEAACELEDHGYSYSDLDLGDYQNQADKLIRSSTITVFGADCEPHQVTVQEERTVARGEGDEQLTVTDTTAGTEMVLNWDSEQAVASIQAADSTVTVIVLPDGTAEITGSNPTTVSGEDGQPVETNTVIVPIEYAEAFAWAPNAIPDQYTVSIEAVAQVDAETDDQGGDTAFRFGGPRYSPPRPSSFTSWARNYCKVIPGSCEQIQMPGGGVAYAATGPKTCCPDTVRTTAFTTDVYYRRDSKCPSSKPFDAYTSR